MLNQSSASSSSSSTKNYIDVCGEISECNNNSNNNNSTAAGATATATAITAATQHQRVLGIGSRQLKLEESVAATGAGPVGTSCIPIVNDAPNMNTHDEVCFFPHSILPLIV